MLTLLHLVFSVFLFVNPEESFAAAEQSFSAHVQENLQKIQAPKSLWEELEKTGYMEDIGPDADYRAKYVNIQCAVEASLADTQDIEVVAVIHTALPPTPLRTIPKNVENADIKATITNRALVLGRFLDNDGHRKLFTVYPQSSTPEGMDVYKENLAKHPKTLIDNPFDGEFKKEITGATYIFKDKTGQIFLFSIKALQANKPEEKAHWALWYAPLSHAKAQERFKEVNAFLASVGIKIQWPQ